MWFKKDITAPSPEARETLRTTYLRPLRDAAAQMKAGRNSRLSQIVSSIPNLMMENRMFQVKIYLIYHFRLFLIFQMTY